MSDDIVERVARAMLQHINDSGECWAGDGAYEWKGQLCIDVDGTVPLSEIAQAALAAIQETHAIVPKDRIDSEALAELIAMDADLIAAADGEG